MGLTARLRAQRSNGTPAPWVAGDGTFAVGGTRNPDADTPLVAAEHNAIGVYLDLVDSIDPAALRTAATALQATDAATAAALSGYADSHDALEASSAEVTGTL